MHLPSDMPAENGNSTLRYLESLFARIAYREKKREPVHAARNMTEEPGVPSILEPRVSHHNSTIEADSGNTTKEIVVSDTAVINCFETIPLGLYGDCTPSPEFDLGALSIDGCVSCSMDRHNVKQPMLAARYRKLFEHSCLNFNDQLQSLPLCKCGHFATGTEHWFNFPDNTRGQPFPLASNESAVYDPAGPYIADSKSPKVVAWAPLKEVRLYSTKRPVTEVPGPGSSAGAVKTDGEATGQLKQKQWWSLRRLVKIFKTPLYTDTWEAMTTDDEITDDGEIE
ncbi:hypothetical protein FPQ18DRAFT_309271 [Pyronema domesticum]|nr:hypothetical protein FPQ18DRAFT_309271 [Pyronema domesticum]